MPKQGGTWSCRRGRATSPLRFPAVNHLDLGSGTGAPSPTCLPFPWAAADAVPRTGLWTPSGTRSGLWGQTSLSRPPQPRPQQAGGQGGVTKSQEKGAGAPEGKKLQRAGTTWNRGLTVTPGLPSRDMMARMSSNLPSAPQVGHLSPTCSPKMYQTLQQSPNASRGPSPRQLEAGGRGNLPSPAHEGCKPGP